MDNKDEMEIDVDGTDVSEEALVNDPVDEEDDGAADEDSDVETMDEVDGAAVVN